MDFIICLNVRTSVRTKDRMNNGTRQIIAYDFIPYHRVKEFIFMCTLGKIYKLWADSQADSSEIIQLWCKLDAYLQAHCDDEIRETMESFLMDYSQRIEHQAFLAGFEEAFWLWKDLLHNTWD